MRTKREKTRHQDWKIKKENRKWERSASNGILLGGGEGGKESKRKRNW